jgi:hypothetical protein
MRSLRVLARRIISSNLPLDERQVVEIVEVSTLSRVDPGGLEHDGLEIEFVARGLAVGL